MDIVVIVHLLMILITTSFPYKRYENDRYCWMSQNLHVVICVWRNSFLVTNTNKKCL